MRESRDGQPVSQPSPAAASAGQAARDGQSEAARRSGPSGEFYISPFLTFDARSLTVIFQIRDTESGDVTRQFPAEEVVERYRQDPSARPFVLPEPADATEEQPGPPPPTIGGPVAAAASEAEQQAGGDPTLTGAAQSLTQAAVPTTSQAAAPRTADEAGSQPSSVPARPSVDLVA